MNSDNKKSEFCSHEHFSTWSKSFQKSLDDNSQLVFSKKITVSTINPEDNIPNSEILDIQEIKNLEGMFDTALICFVDNRTIFYNCLKKNSMAHVTNYFPLSREKYKSNCLVFSLSGNGEHILSPANKEQFRKYSGINYHYNNKTHTGTISLTEDQYKVIAEEYFFQYLHEVNKTNKEAILNAYWSKLTSEEKLDYETVDKDSLKNDEGKIISKDDLEKFEAQEEIFYSKNFTVLFLIPLDMEHSIYPMPQVVANSRRPNFESLMKPHKKPKKYLFILNFSDGKWNFKELNA